MWEIHEGDCLDVMRGMADASVDAVITDPPWMDYTTGRYDASEWHAPVTFLSPERYCAALYRVMRPDSALMLWCRWDCFQAHADAATFVGFTVRNCVVWAKPNHTAGDLDGNLGNKHEMAVFAVKGQWRRHMRRETNLWSESHLFSRAKRHHPTEKPVNLMERCIRLVVPEGGTVLDPFAGSGTTGVACVNTGRHFIGIEQDSGYCAIARARLAAAAAQPRLCGVA